MQVAVINVTPQLAKSWLKENTHNRNLNEKLVNDYARQILAGEWRLNGEAIKRAKDGRLLDGQHRLAAIVLTGVSVQLLVIEELDPELQDTMDAGRKRSTSDVFSINGEANANNLAVVARKIWMWDRGSHRFPSSPNPSTTELKAVVEKYPSLRRSAEVGTRTAMNFRATRGSVTGTAHHLFLQIDPDLTAEFFAQLASGAELKTGHPVLALRNRLTQDKIMQKKVPFHLGVALYIRAWNGRREDRDMARLVHTAEEPMVMPL